MEMESKCERSGKKWVFRLDASGLYTYPGMMSILGLMTNCHMFELFPRMFFGHVGHFSFLGWLCDCFEKIRVMPENLVIRANYHCICPDLEVFPSAWVSNIFSCTKTINHACVLQHVCACVLVTQDACDQQSREWQRFTPLSNLMDIWIKSGDVPNW